MWNAIQKSCVMLLSTSFDRDVSRGMFKTRNAFGKFSFVQQTLVESGTQLLDCLRASGKAKDAIDAKT